MRVLLTHLCHPGHCQGVYHTTIQYGAKLTEEGVELIIFQAALQLILLLWTKSNCMSLSAALYNTGWPSSLIIHAADCFLGITIQPGLFALLHFCNPALEPISSPTLHLELNIICRNNNWGWIWFAQITIEVAFNLQRIFDIEHTSHKHKSKTHYMMRSLVLCLKFKLNRDKRTTMETDSSYLPFEFLNPLVQRVQLLLLLLARSLCSA